jgi:uncharacterized iron-regulated protein
MTSLRIRRSAAQLHGLAGVEREIRSCAPNGRRKYLQDFSQAFRSYQAVIHPSEVKSMVAGADIVLIGDYHALPASQRFAAALFEERAQPGDRPVVLGVETIFSRDQHILDEWWRREIDEEEFRQRIRFDLDWGYDWSPFYELLVTAREHAECIYGLDCMPRGDLRKIGARDRHAAHKIAEIHQRHPNAVIMTLFGESHLAPGHLPRVLQKEMPSERVLTVLQNVDALYWRAAGEQAERVEAVRVTDDVVCIFNSTPLEKYENYRLCLVRWGQEGKAEVDAGPTIYNLVDSLLRFLGVDRYSSHNGTQPKFLVDLLPEVISASSDEGLRRLLSRHRITEEEIEPTLKRVEERGSTYLPQANAFYVREFQMMYAAEDVTRFLHHACRGLPGRGYGQANVPNIATDVAGHSAGHSEDSFYSLVLEHALSYFGSRVLYPARPAVRGSATNGGHDCELSRAAFEEIAEEASQLRGESFEAQAQQLGHKLGSALYDAYLVAQVSRSMLRRIFLAHIEEPGKARTLCLQLVGKVRSTRARAANA